jgi:hypothetical protein
MELSSARSEVERLSVQLEKSRADYQARRAQPYVVVSRVVTSAGMLVTVFAGGSLLPQLRVVGAARDQITSG